MTYFNELMIWTIHERSVAYDKAAEAKKEGKDIDYVEHLSRAITLGEVKEKIYAAIGEIKNEVSG